MKYKVFSERLNQELDSIGVPSQIDERLDVFMKLLKISRFKATALLNGEILPTKETLEILANELEVSPSWLIGEQE